MQHPDACPWADSLSLRSRLCLGDALDCQGLHGLHQENANAVKHQRAAYKRADEQGDIAHKSVQVDAGAGQVSKAYIVEDLGRIGMDKDQQSQHNAQRNKEAEEVAQNGGQCANSQKGKYREYKSYQTAQLNGQEAILHIALKGEQHDVAYKDEPAVFKAHQMDDCVCNEDPYQKGRAKE